MNKLLISIIMKNYLKTIASTMVMFALVISAFAAPLASVNAITTTTSDSASSQSSSQSSESSASASVSLSCSVTASRTTVFVGESVTVNWTTSGYTNVTINGETVSQTSGSRTYTNLQVNTTFVLTATDGNGSTCTSSVTVFCEQPPVDVRCTLTPTSQTIQYGGTATLNWTTQGGEGAIISGIGRVEENGSITVGPLFQNTTYTLTVDEGLVFSPHIPVTCTAVVTVLPPEEPEFCELVVTKTADKNTANVGDSLTYTITVENIGDADCTGGVKIEDALDTYVRYVSHSLTSNLQAGYLNTPVYTSINRTLHFNGFVLEPGESGQIVVTTEVLSPAQCGDFQVQNQARATALELNNFNNWSNSSLVITSINNDCPVDDRFAQVVAHKIICIDESELPNYGNGGPNITSSTASDWVSSNDSCSFASGWEFEWTDDQLNSPADDYVGRAGGPWSTFGATDSNGRANVQINLDTLSDNRVWFREVLKSGYIPFTYGLNGQTNVDDFSAEMYCNTSVVNYDNRDLIEGMVDGGTYYCVAWNHIVVDDETTPVCELFTASPSQLPVGGGDVTLNWRVIDASEVTIQPNVGTVGLTGTRVLPVTQSTTYTLTASDVDGNQVSCNAPVVVPDPVPFTCSNNVSFTASDYSITRGQSIDLNWSTTDVDSVSISVINSTALSGSQVVSPTSDTTYVLRATKDSVSIDCPISVDVSTGGGGGGGTPTPRCDLEISKSKIKLGEEVTLTWDTSNATEITIRDDRGEILFTTADYLANEKRDYYDGSLRIKPTRDTEFTLTAERGSRDRECSVDVELDDDVVVLQTRDQQPLVTGISLTEVPYTGFEAGPVMTILFYLLLIAWALYITYILVIRKRLAGLSEDEPIMDIPTFGSHGHSVMQKAVEKRPDAFVESITTAPTMTAVPTNLPTGNPVIGYENYVETEVNVNPHQVSDAVVTELENRAHAQKALLSSDAVRHFIANTEGSVERNEALDEVVAEAKKAYPLEDGWIVINEARMTNLCEVCAENKKTSSVNSYAPATVPTGTGSLAEAIVTGNVVAAYEMIGHRPMFALADAAADLDSVYRNRKGAKETVSNLLTEETKSLSDEQIRNMISALTGALDGTYTDEASAVKMAIMKAVKEVA